MMGQHEEPSLRPPEHVRIGWGAPGGGEGVGDEFLGYFRELCALEPDDAVLDVGCGSGRMAIPLTSYLSSRGRYEGFDIVPDRIRWCVENVSPRHPNFHFQVADVYNKAYNPKAKTEASEYRFPFEDESFDLVTLTSVFTHMLPADVEQYLSEIVRVLRRGGRSMITYLLVNDESLALLHSTRDRRRDPALNAAEALFSHEHGVYRLTNPEIPEQAVAFREDYILGLYEKLGLDRKGPVHYGAWPGRDEYLTWQDAIVAERP
jgi:SAM-dependent methyltransferase